MKPQLYVTFRWRIPGGLSRPRAIICPNDESQLRCASDVSAYAATRYVRTKRSGRLRKDTVIIPWNDYTKGQWIKK